MGKIVDFVKYREKAVPNQRDGLYVETQPPFVIIGSWENGDIWNRCLRLRNRLASRHENHQEKYT